jgi:hypothetical protein
MGCATTWKPLDVAALDRAKPKALLVVVEEPDPFFGVPKRNPMLFAFGAFGAAIAAAQRPNGMDDVVLSDPSERLGAEVGESFAKAHGLTRRTIKRPAAQRQRLPVTDADLVLSVGTTSWGLDHNNRALRPVVRLTVAVALTDAHDHRVLAGGERHGDEGKAAPPSADSDQALLENGGALLDTALEHLGDRCIVNLSSELLFAPVTPERRAPPKGPATPPSSPEPEFQAPAVQQSDSE